MKILVTGSNGQLGWDVCRELDARGIACTGADKADFDITDYNQTKRYLLNCRPDAVIHCAAYTAVDRAEEEAEICRNVNAEGTKHIAMVCEQMGAKLLYISTDYVFGGDGADFYETDDPKNPPNIYGKTKLMGEEAVRTICSKSFIVRTSWVFGKNGCNFVKTMLRLGREKGTVTVVSDQIGSPTYTADLAKVLCDMVLTEKYGTYHATNANLCSWAEFAEQIMKEANIDAEVIPTSTRAYGAKAKRPLNSRLSKKSLTDNGFEPLPSWQNALRRFIEEIKE